MSREESDDYYVVEIDFADASRRKINITGT